MKIDKNKDVPVYQQLVNCFVQDINGGRMPAGTKLPTVRALAETLDISNGTVKHAYDALEQLGYIEKVQGSGSFVSDKGVQGGTTSKKTQAIDAIERALDVMETLGFSQQETRIFFDLCLRGREEKSQDLRIGVIDCSPEASSVFCEQLSLLPGVDVYDYSLEDTLAHGAPFSPPVDLVITTPTHYEALSEIVTEGLGIVQMVLAPSHATVSQLSRMPDHARVGILCASRRFSSVIANACALYCPANISLAIQLLGSVRETANFLDKIDVLILPPSYLRFCTAAERDLLLPRNSKADIEYIYEIEKGSLVYLNQVIERLRAEKIRKK